MRELLVKNTINILNGFAFDSTLFNNRKIGLPIARIRDVTRGYSNTYFSGDYSNEYIINNGAILIGMDGEFNIAVWGGGKALLNQRVCRVIPNPMVVDDTYIKYRLAVLLKEIERNTPFVTVKHLSSEKLKREILILPSLQEQHHIAAILDKADRLSRLRRFALDLGDSYLQSVFLEMFGDPGKNPYGWKRGKIGEVVKFSQYGTSTKSNDEQLGYPVLGMGSITYAGEVDLSNISYVEISEEEFNSLRLERGDIIFNRTNSTDLVGKTAYWDLDMDAVIASYLVKLKLRENVLPEYFTALLNSSYFKSLFQIRCRKAVGQSNVSPTYLKEFPVLIPPIPLQEKYAEILISRKRFMSQQREALRQAEHLFQSILVRAFEGEL